MCITSAPARLSKTILYAGETLHQGLLTHVLGYQNQAENTSGRANAMILPIPSLKAMGPDNMIDTREAKTFLEDMRKAIAPDVRRTRSLATKGFGADSYSVQVFDKGSYTVVLADAPSLVTQALGLVDPLRRPSISPELLAAFEKWYPGWPLAVCCFNGSVAPEPLLWWYEPRDPAYLWAPGVDAHDGGIPKLGNPVDVDHTVIFGSTLQDVQGAATVRSPSMPEAMAKILASKVTGSNFIGKKMMNGDFKIDRTQLATPWATQRAAPPGA